MPHFGSIERHGSPHKEEEAETYRCTDCRKKEEDPHDGDTEGWKEA
ncbi:hypothetical protein PSMK_11390 [Phycisphaera mikurensis NBRC 102666]|uniref:Uncharacterized protein n=1 Tax=Phycisphaera mikurensis (strain NBRC 102666 / KCTC 22515 / FYK2301M01) TaxID=1142394 RepID=I0IDG0_PHYMF|nr:hypothetical protein PSMK_11390 [Phycisphaera mikurensis NBRC 102666]